VTGGPGWVRAVAVDFDGTLTPGGRPAPHVLAALAETRRRGTAVVLVTGRILTELAAVFPDVDDHVDLVCAEDGAVLHGPGWTRHLTDPVDPRLDAALRARGVPFRRGEVILATTLPFAAAVEAAAAETGVRAPCIRNRGELMIVPGGVDKGHGTRAALAVLGVSHHHAVAIGDAENDLPMLRAVEIGAAPANAVAATSRAADLALAGGAGDAVAELLTPRTLSAAAGLRPRRWDLEVGAGDDGVPVTVPGSRAVVLVSGPSGSGKSSLAGMLAEELVRARDTLLVIDPEGDYAGLGVLPGVRVIDGGGPAPSAPEVARAFRDGVRAIVLDLSLLDRAGRRDAVAGLLPHLAAGRRRGGVPHWLLVDEAHEFCDVPGMCGPGDGALLAVTYLPGALPAALREAADAEILLPGATGCAGRKGIPEATLAELARRGRGHAVVVRHGAAALARVAPARCRHVRHWHKYVAAHLPELHRFTFRHPGGAPTGAVATNMAAFHDLLRDAPPEVVAHHCACGDPSRWVREVLGDGSLAHRLAAAEALARDAGPEAARAAMLAAIAERYPARAEALHAGVPGR